MRRYTLRDNIDTIAVVGYPAAGKGTLAKGLVQDVRGLQKFGVGDMVRRLMKIDPAFKEMAQSHAAEGRNVPDDVILPYIEEALRKLPPGQPWYLDGVPRTEDQIKPFEDMMHDLRRKVAMVYLELGSPEESVRIADERIEKRALEALEKGIDVRHDDIDPIVRATRLRVAGHDLFKIVDSYSERGNLVSIDATQNERLVQWQVRKKLLLHPNEVLSRSAISSEQEKVVASE